MSSTETVDRFAGRDWPSWTEPEISVVDGLPTAYRRSGSGEPLLYLHGAGFTRAWIPFHEQLSKTFDVIAPEHPGFGDTPLAPGMDNWTDWVLHYDAFLRTQGIENAHLVGNGVGAWLAADLALYYPERFPSVTLIAPLGVRLEPTDPHIDYFRPPDSTGRAALFNGRESEYADLFVQQGEFEDGLQKFAEDTTLALLMWNPRYDIKLDVRLRRIEVPTLIIAPEDDRVAGQAAAPRFAELIPGSRLQVVPGPGGEPSSHGLVIEQPGEVADLIAEHTGRVADVAAG